MYPYFGSLTLLYHNNFTWMNIFKEFLSLIGVMQDCINSYFLSASLTGTHILHEEPVVGFSQELLTWICYINRGEKEFVMLSA